MIRNVILLIFAGAASGYAADACQTALEAIAADNNHNARPASDVAFELNQKVRIQLQQACVAQLLHATREELKRARLPAVEKSMQGRLNNEQTGTTTAPQGSTSPMSKPATSLLSMVSEYGGVTTSTQNTTTTLQIAPFNLASTLATKGTVLYCNQQLAITKDCIKLGSLKRLSFTVTGNTNTSAKMVTATPAAGSASTGSTAKVTATAMGQNVPSFAGATGKYVLAYQKGSPPTFQTDWTSVDTRIDTLTRDLNGHPLYLAWQDCLRAELNRAVWVDPSANPRVPKPLPEAMKALDAAVVDYEKIDDIIRGRSFTTCNGQSVAALSPADQAKAQTSAKQIADDIALMIVELDRMSAQIDVEILQTMTTPMLSAEYDFSTPANQPSNSTVKVAFSYIHTVNLKNAAIGKSPAIAPNPAAAKNSAQPSCPFTQSSSGAAGGGAQKAPDMTKTVACPSWTLTANFGLSWYSTEPASTIPGASLLRDAQAGVEWDKNIASSQWKGIGHLLGDTTFSATYYFQDQTSPSILNVTPGSPSAGITLIGLPSTASQVFAAKGDIHFFQLKYGFGTGTNVKFPVAVSWSNRTDLVPHPNWGAQIGISYNFTSLLSSSGGVGKTP